MSKLTDHSSGSDWTASIGALAEFREAELGQLPSVRFLGRGVGVSPTTVSAWLGGNRFPQRVELIVQLVGLIRAHAQQVHAVVVDPDLLSSERWRAAYEAEARRRAGATTAATVASQARVTLAGLRPGVSSYYLARVEVLVPLRLEDRHEELGELARFCLNPESAGRYVWWQADAWVGKTALLSTFVVDPPAGVQLVAFFVTGSQPDQSDRRAFVDNILEQLYALREISPQPLTESTRETYMLGLLADTARMCRDRGEHFVLVVDGLDEDRGMGGKSGTHSIAALLPRNLPSGMRVIVAGRSSPPLPKDVPDHHPLREPAVIRPLAPSVKANAVREDKERDLKRLLRGSPIEQDVLGLLVAAAAGLTTQDLVELIGASEWDIEDSLGTASGRSFTRRPTASPHRGRDVYTFAHDDLMVTARSMLGSKVAGYRQRLHSWADSYTEKRWPSGTPEYLLRGYFAMLTTEQDLSRMLACATDPQRRRLAFARSGSDGAALREIQAAQDVILASSKPDLIALARLAVHREHLHHGTSRLPVSLPSGWAALGQLDRAESMIESIRQPHDRVLALTLAVEVCWAQGELERARRMLDQAEELAATWPQFWGADPLQTVAVTATRCDDHDRARSVVALIRTASERAEALAMLAIEAADAEEADRANALLDEADGVLRAEDAGGSSDALGAMAVAALKLNDVQRSRALLDEAQASLEADRDWPTARYAGGLARYAALAGDDERAVQLVNLIDDEASREPWMERVLRITAKRAPQRAETIARTTAEPWILCARLATVASSVGRDERGRASRLCAEAQGTLELILDPKQQTEARLLAAVALADLGEIDQAMTITRDYAELGTDADAVLAVAAAAIRGRHLDYGAELLLLAENVARRLVNKYAQRTSVLWTRTLADHEDFDRAEEQARLLTDHTAQDSAWAAITEGAIAADLLDRAEQALSAISDPKLQWRPRLDLIRARLAASQPERARAIASRAHSRQQTAHALLLVARETRNGDVLDDVDSLIESFTEPADRMGVLLGIAEVAANWGDRDRTTTVLGRLRSIAEAIGNDLGDEPGTAFASPREIVKFCSAPIRSLTEVSERASSLHKLLLRLPHETATSWVPAQPQFIETSNLPWDEAIARRLAEYDWAYAVEELVERCPGAYQAIIAELELLAVS